MKNIILYGAPAAGKGTQCELLVEKYGYKHISTGQLFRELDDSTEFNREIHDKISKGILIDDVTTAKLLQNKLDEIGNVPVILDGFPRNLNQAHILDEFFTNYIVININIDEEVAMKRALGRLTCDGCGKIFNKYFEHSKPKVEDICDYCGAHLSSRSDDNEESFKKRFNIYLENVKSIFNYYEKKDLLYLVDAHEQKEDTFECIKNILEEVK